MDILKLTPETLKGKDLNSKDVDGKTLFHQICSRNDLNKTILHQCLDQGADLNIPNKYGYTPFQELCMNTFDPEIITICKDANFNHANMYGSTPFHYLCNRPFINLDLLKICISYGANIHSKDFYDRTSFYFLCPKVTLEMLQYCLELNVNLNETVKEYDISVSKCVSGDTPFHQLCQNKNMNMQMLDLCISKGANLNNSYNNNKTPFYYMCINDLVTPEMFHYCLLLNTTFDLMWICKSKNMTLDMLKTCIIANGNLDSRNSENETAFYHLCSKCDLEMLEYCLSLNADLNARSNYGFTPFHRLCARGDMTLVKRCLGENNGNLNNRTQYGNTALYDLLGNAHVIDMDLLKKCIEHNGDLNIQTSYGDTPFHNLCYNESMTPEMLQYCLNEGKADGKVKM